MKHELLKGDKIVLREMRDDDLELIHDWENRSELWHLGEIHEPLSEAQISDFINHSTGDIYTDEQLRLMIDVIDSTSSLRGKNDRSNLPKDADCHTEFIQSEVEVIALTIGCIDLFEFDKHNQRAGVGILIAEASNRKKGFAKDALNVLTNYCFETLNFRQLYCHIPVDNEASLRLFVSCGFEQTGTNRDWVKKRNTFIDAMFMQRLR